MHPRLFTTPYFTLHTFGVLLALAFVAAMWWLVRAARRDGLDPDRLTSLGFWAIAGGILGSKLLLVLRTLPDFISGPSQFWSLSFLESAGDFYGGFHGVSEETLLVRSEAGTPPPEQGAACDRKKAQEPAGRHSRHRSSSAIKDVVALVLDDSVTLAGGRL